MITAEIAVPVLSDIDHRRQLRRAVIASTIGTTIEWYDFFLYGTAAALVFNKIFFPTFDPFTGRLRVPELHLRIAPLIGRLGPCDAATEYDQ